MALSNTRSFIHNIILKRFLDLQITVKACDQRDPQKCISIGASITIIRNAQSPSFINLPGNTNIPQGRKSGDIVFTVSAQDPDIRAPVRLFHFQRILLIFFSDFFFLPCTIFFIVFIKVQFTVNIYLIVQIKNLCSYVQYNIIFNGPYKDQIRF